MEFPAEEVSIKDLNHGRKPIQIIGLASVVQALGGKTKLDIPKRRLDLWLKP